MRYEPMEREFWEDPHEFFRALRDQDHLHFAPGANAFCVTRYDEAASVFKQPELFSSKGGFDMMMGKIWKSVGPRDVVEMLRFLWRARVNPLAVRQAPESIISSDPPRHGPLRQTVNRGFTPRRIAAWEGRVRQLAGEALAGLEERAHFDLVRELAHPLPTTIIAEMLGVETHRIADFRRWSDGLIGTVTSSQRSGSPGDFLANAGGLVAYLREMVEARRKQPGDDLISVLVDPRHGDTLDTRDVLVFLVVLLVAGNETTKSAIGNSVEILLERADVLRQVADDPGLLPAFVEESLRFHSPLQLMPRFANRDTEIRGTPIPAGSHLLVMLGSANRDERRFDAPDTFDLQRDNRGHLAFGHGIHFCLGASLARLETQLALETAIPLLKGRALRRDAAVRSDSYFTRGYAELVVEREQPAWRAAG